MYIYIYIYNIYIYYNIYYNIYFNVTIYIHNIYYMITGKVMKLDLDNQSFMQNTFTIFSLTIFSVLTLKITV